MVHYTVDIEEASGRNSPKTAAPKLDNVSEPPYRGYHSVNTTGFQHSSADSAIVIDNGATSVLQDWI